MRAQLAKELKEQINSLKAKLEQRIDEDLTVKKLSPGEIDLNDPESDEVTKLQSMTPDEQEKVLDKVEQDIKETAGLEEKRGYSAKSAHAGHDIGKKGKNFTKIASSAGKKYGSKAAGERVAGAVLAKLRNEGLNEGLVAKTNDMMEGMEMFISGQVDEKLKPSMGVGAYIDDFVHSKNKRFDGKSKEQRIKMAKGAYYGATKESVNEEAMDVEHFTMTPELLLRSMEWAKENAGEDIQLHKYIEAMSDLMTAKDVLDSDNYEEILSLITPNDPSIDDEGSGIQKVNEAPAPGKKIKPLPRSHSSFKSELFTGPSSYVPYEAYQQGIYDYYHNLECPYTGNQPEDQELLIFWNKGHWEAENKGVSYDVSVVPELKNVK